MKNGPAGDAGVKNMLHKQGKICHNIAANDPRPAPRRESGGKENGMERLFKKVTGAGILAVILGIVTITAGVAVGVLSIISGARLLRERDVITF